MHYYIVLSAIIMVSGCAKVPDYNAPQYDAPDIFISQNVLTTLSTSPDNNLEVQNQTNWWKGFGDEILNDLVAKGLANNNQIMAADARVAQALSQIKIAKAGLAPQVGLDADIGASAGLDTDGGSDLDSNSSIGIAGILPLDVSGRIANNIASAQYAYEFALAQREALVIDIAVSITSQYLQLRGDQRQLELLQESIELQQKTLKIVTVRFETGLSPELDVQRAKTSVENLQADTPPLMQSMLDGRNRLATLTGEYAGVHEDKLSQYKDLPDYSAIIPDILPLNVLRVRPDVAQAEANLKIALANVGIAEAEFYPTFSLSGGLRAGATGVGLFPDVGDFLLTIAGLVDQTLLDGGARQANLDRANASVREAQANHREVLLNAVEDVEVVLSAIQSSKARQISLEKAVESSARGFDQAETLYQLGLTSFLDVVDAQRVLANANQALARARTDYAVQISNLFGALAIQNPSD